MTDTPNAIRLFAHATSQWRKRGGCAPTNICCALCSGLVHHNTRPTGQKGLVNTMAQISNLKNAPAFLVCEWKTPDGQLVGTNTVELKEFGSGAVGYWGGAPMTLMLNPAIVRSDTGSLVRFQTQDQAVAIKSKTWGTDNDPDKEQLAAIKATEALMAEGK